MKRNPDYVLRKIVDECMLIPTGKAAQDFNGMITLNETAEYIWTHLEEAESPEALADMVTAEFEIDSETAYRDVCGLLRELCQVGMIYD